jgi:hypothetical protein
MCLGRESIVGYDLHHPPYLGTHTTGMTHIKNTSKTLIVTLCVVKVNNREFAIDEWQ